MDRGRYGRVVRLFTRFGLELWWLDAGRRLRSAGRQRRLEHRTYARQARRFREVAEGLGGLIIKLGQYLSVRVDILNSRRVMTWSAACSPACRRCLAASR